ncbi:glycosyltransferase [Nocardia sp. NRRL S-836]|uniref:glycosyltransferase n=1 Tax=Nocardia sp. NRRL S-836 TaxID=1519492 RepID=UPI0006AF1CB2|nr:glycosyltransferase [Nocardia sp. NRRL S-836]
MLAAQDAPGWRAAHVEGLSAALSALGHEVAVHHPPADLPGQQLGQFVDSLRTEWARARPDLVHGHSWRPGLAAVLAAQPSGVPVIQSFHGLGTGAGQRTGVERLVGKQAALVVATCEHELLELAAAGVPRSRIALAARGVDVELFQPRGDTAQRTGLRRIVTVADPMVDNGLVDLVAALPRLGEVELVIAGTPGSGEADRITRCARRFGVDERVRLLGVVPRAELPALLRSADVVACVPPQATWDALALEAMACGVPVVATAVGGLTDAVIDGVTGVLVPPRDLKQLVRRLRAVLDDETFRNTCEIAGVDRVQARHTWPDVGRSVERLYRHVLEPATPTRKIRAPRPLTTRDSAMS